MTLLWTIFLLGSLILIAGYLQGVRINRALAWWTAHEIERFLRVEEGTYTWMGGVMGFEGHLRGKYGPVHTVVTFLPRHALLYYPVARFLTSRGDRIRIRCRGKDFLFVGRLHSEKERRRFQEALKTFAEGLDIPT